MRVLNRRSVCSLCTITVLSLLGSADSVGVQLVNVEYRVDSLNSHEIEVATKAMNAFIARGYCRKHPYDNVRISCYFGEPVGFEWITMCALADSLEADLRSDSCRTILRRLVHSNANNFPIPSEERASRVCDKLYYQMKNRNSTIVNIKGSRDMIEFVIEEIEMSKANH